MHEGSPRRRQKVNQDMGTYVPFMIIVREEGGREDPAAWDRCKEVHGEGDADGKEAMVEVERVDGAHGHLVRASPVQSSECACSGVFRRRAGGEKYWRPPVSARVREEVL